MAAIDHKGVIRQFPELEWEASSGSLILSPEKVDEVVSWLKEDPAYRLDYLSCVSGVDYLEKEVKTRVRNEAGKMVFKTSLSPEKMEVVYHFYSMEKKTGPFIMKQRVLSRENPVVGSLAPHYVGGRINGTGGLRPLWHSLYGASRSPPDPHVGGFSTLSDAQGLRPSQ